MSPGHRQYSITELAKEFEVSTRTIRFYEEKGYINPRRDGQKRIYSAADRTRIRLILRGKRIGMSLAECVEIIDMYQPDADNQAQVGVLLERVQARRELLLQQQRDLDAMLRALDDVEALCRSRMADGAGAPLPAKQPARRAAAS